MSKRVIALMFIASAVLAADASAQQCLHGPTETADEAARRKDALAAVRMVNTIEANQPGAAKGVFLRQSELADSPTAKKMRESSSDVVKRIALDPNEDVVPGWSLNLDITENGYWLMVTDKRDPCRFAFVSNREGVIFTATPIR